MIEQIKKCLDIFDRKGYVPEVMRVNCESMIRYLIGEVERLNGKVTYKETIVGYSVELIEDLEKKVEELQKALKEIETMDSASWAVSIVASEALERSKSQ